LQEAAKDLAAGRTEMSCLMCKHFKPIPPADWTPSYRGEEYNRYDVRTLIKTTKHHQKGQCALNPVHVDVLTNHYCGQFVDDTRSRDDNPAYRVSTFIWGDYNSRYVNELKEWVAMLKRQLKTTRARSVKRLQRLKQVKTGT
jgi:hypothetical protein